MVIQWLRFRAPNGGVTDLIPSRGTKIPHGAALKKQNNSMPVVTVTQLCKYTKYCIL